jgi:phosphoglycolate phosphatase-like HAD superfamily hydrolase
MAAVRAAIFDLDRVLLDTSRAWRYTIEEAVAMATGRRVDAGPLVDEYRLRPWTHALSILVPASPELARCEELCRQMTARSGMKRLLVYDGIGMGLDALRAARIEMGAISRSPHPIALKQVQSTGLDRFLTVLSATPEHEPWQPNERITRCLRFVEREPRDAAFIGAAEADLEAAGAMGLWALAAGWCVSEQLTATIGDPRDIVKRLANRS